VEKRETSVKITLPKKMEAYKALRKELEKSNKLAPHYVDKTINDAYSILESWKRMAEKGKALLRKPALREYMSGLNQHLGRLRVRQLG